MGLTFRVIALLLLVPLVGFGQQNGFQDSLLNHLAGEWILKGAIAGQQTTHDVSAKWVLDHQYLEVHEVSREKDSVGKPTYEALVFIGWDSELSEYDCLWLDVTGGGGLSGQPIGHGRNNGFEIPFEFKSKDGSVFRNVFQYDPSTDAWKWLMDGEENGTLQPFARLTLTRH